MELFDWLVGWLVG